MVNAVPRCVPQNPIDASVLRSCGTAHTDHNAIVAGNSTPCAIPIIKRRINIKMNCVLDVKYMSVETKVAVELMPREVAYTHFAPILVANHPPNDKSSLINNYLKNNKCSLPGICVNMYPAQYPPSRICCCNSAQWNCFSSKKPPFWIRLMGDLVVVDV